HPGRECGTPRPRIQPGSRRLAGHSGGSGQADGRDGEEVRVTRRALLLLGLAAGCGGSRRAQSPSDASPQVAAVTGDGGLSAPRPTDPPPAAAGAGALVSFDVPELPGPANQVVTQNPIEPDPCTLPPDARFAAITDPPPGA